MQIYRIFLTYLIIMIVKMNMHLRQNQPLHDPHIEFKCFDNLQNKVHPTKTSIKSQKPSQDIKLLDKHVHMLNDIFKAFKWLTKTFISNYKCAYSFMVLKFIKDDLYVCNSILIWIVIMSGLCRNSGSSNRNRDWEKIAIAAILETAIVNRYYESLLSKCPSANQICRDLATYLFTHYSRVKKPSYTPSQTVSVTSWMFLKGISIHDAASDKQMGFNDSKSLITEWHRVSNMDATYNSDPIARVIHMLESNKYLTCSSDDAGPGSIEMLAHNLILGLVHVGPALSPLSHISYHHLCSDHILEQSKT